MKLLFLSNFYPPASRGGYEEWCCEVAQGLRGRGHDVVVLTSRHGRDAVQPADPPWVVRDLYLEMELASLRNGIQFFTHRAKREEANLRTLRRMLDDSAPDAVLIWGMWNLPRSLPSLAEQRMQNRVAYYFGDYWPTLPGQFEEYWQHAPRNWVTALPKQVLGSFARRKLKADQPCRLDYVHAMFPTTFLQQELQRRGVTPGESAVVHGGVDTGPYLQHRRNEVEQDEHRFTFLFVGRLVHDKGVHTALEALSEVVHQRGYRSATIVIVGSGDGDYEEALRAMVRRERIEDHVTFTGPQPKDALPEVYANADAFLFTSIWPEPFGRVIVEAMASGLVVIGTPTGGAAEILIDEQNALTFPPEDASTLADQMARLMDSASLRRKLSAAGQQTAVANFDIGRMTAGIESFLIQIANDKPMS